MSKIILKFDATEEQVEANDAMNGHKWKAILFDLDQMLRGTTKYGNSVIPRGESATDLEMEVADRYRQIIQEMMNDSGLKFDL